MMKLLHLSDPHFGTERAHVAAALVDWVRSGLQPDVVVLSGDLTQRARRAQFDALRRFIDALGAPKLVALPGNHDIPLFDVVGRIVDPYRGYRRVLGAQHDAVLSTPEVLIVAMDTTRRCRHRHGDVSREQIDVAARALAGATREQLRIVVTHQPVAVPTERERNNRVRGADAVVATLGDAGADLMLAGHIHWPALIPLAGSSRRTWALLAGTAVSRRVRPAFGNSCNVVEWDAPALVCWVERWDAFDVAGRAEWRCVERVAVDVDRG